MKAADAKKAIQDMTDHSQKWHNGTSTRTRTTDTSDELAIIEAQLNNLGREINKVNKRVDNGNSSYQEQRQTMEESLSKFMSESAKRHDENSSLIKEIRASIDAAIRNQGALIKALEIQIRKIRKPRMGYQIEASTNMHDSTILKDSLPPKEKDQGSFNIPCHINNIRYEKAIADLGASISVMPYSTFTSLGLGELTPTKLIIKLADRITKHPKGIAGNVLVGIDKFVFLVDFVVLDMPENIKVTLILRRPFLSTAHAKIDAFKRKITLRVGDDKIVFKKLRRNQVEDLGSTIEEGEVIDEPMEDIVKTRNDDNEISNGIDKYPSFCDFDRKIHFDCA
nr:hypothetical protein [Tanacetum cinerariifolium]